MFTKRSVIALLVGVNLLLLFALLASSHAPPAAYAQGGMKTGEYLAVTAKVAGQTQNALYVLDVRERQLYAFFPTSASSTQLALIGPRDLAKDFDRK
jgi:hypothetical protein